MSLFRVTTSTRQQLDSELCEAIAKIFEFPNTGNIHQQFEAARWRPQTVDLFTQCWEALFSNSDLQHYLAAWGIFYVMKYSGIYSILVASPALSREEKAKKLTEFLHRFQSPDAGLNKVKTIAAMTQLSREKAYEAYLRNITQYWTI